MDEREDVTEVMRRHGVSKGLSALIGLLIAASSAAASYFAYRQAKIEAGVETRGVRGEAAVGYRTLADPVELMLTLTKAHETRIAALEVAVKECSTKVPMMPALVAPAPTGLVPLSSLLLRPLPRTLGEATALAK